MKEEIKATWDWIFEYVAKYGWLIALMVGIWYVSRKIFFWMVMPILFWYLFIETLNLCGVRLAKEIHPAYIVIAWIFLFSFLKKIGGLFFEEQQK